MPRKHALACLLTLACLGASGAAFAEEWHYCVATAGLPDGPNKHVHWAVTQPFEVSGIPDWRAQFEQAKGERHAFAQSRGWQSGADSFICTDAAPSFAAALELRNGTSANFAQRRDIGRGMGLPFTWEDWAWQPSGSGAADAQAAADTTASQDDEDSAAAEGQQQADTAAAEAKRQKEISDAKAERDRLAAEKAKLEKEIADARAERDRLAAEKARQERAAKASTDTDANRCVTSPSLRQHDTFQGNTAAYITNGCSTPVDVRICLMTEAKGWNCGMTMALAPQASWSWSSFHATGQTFVDARVNGSGKTMASP